MEKGSQLTELDVMKKMQSTIRFAVENAAAVDEIVAEMESGGELWKNVLHVSILDTVSEGVARRSFPEGPLQVRRCVCGGAPRLRGARAEALLFALRSTSHLCSRLIGASPLAHRRPS